MEQPSWVDLRRLVGVSREAGYREVAAVPRDRRNAALRVVLAPWGNETRLEPPPAPWPRWTAWRDIPGDHWLGILGQEFEFQALAARARGAPCEDEQAAALRELALQWFDRPIHPLRLRAIEDAVEEELRELHDQGYTLTDLVMAVLGEAIPPDVEDWDPGVLKREIARRVNNLVTEDLLGPDWRRPITEDAGTAERLPDEEPSPLEVLEATERAQAALRLYQELHSTLGGKMRRLLELLHQNADATSADLAAKLGVAPATVRVMTHRLKERARKVRSQIRCQM